MSCLGLDFLFAGFLPRMRRISRVWGRHSPTRFRRWQNERTANYGTSVESCSVTSAYLPPSVSFVSSTISGSGKRRFCKTFSFCQYNTGTALVCSLSDKLFHFSFATTTVGGCCFAKCAGAFLQIFLFTSYYNRFFEMPKMGAKKAANLFQDLLLRGRYDGHLVFSFYRERGT